MCKEVPIGRELSGRLRDNDIHRLHDGLCFHIESLDKSRKKNSRQKSALLLL